MSELIPQFQDLTEWTIGYGPQQENLVTVETEFSFAVAGPTQSFSHLTQIGFKHLSSMNNWWPTHAGQDRELKFLWLKQDNATNFRIAPSREYWRGWDSGTKKSLLVQLAKSGCGFKLAVPPISRREHYRYFTLMRLPVKVSPLQQKFLIELNYRPIDTGKLASYWINGWDPKVYSHDLEYKFFKTTKHEWNTYGGEWWNYNANQHLLLKGDA